MNVSRYTDTTELRFDVLFITPCFLGGADGNAEIRTAPFKNLLRRWWRIANGNLSPEELWQKESELFGSTEKDPQAKKTFGKSRVVVNIVEISPSQPDKYLSSEKIDIGKDEYTNLAMYTGYGSVNMGKEYILPRTNLRLSLFCPSGAAESIKKALFFIHLFGTLGSRSRNGWGSISIQPQNFKFIPQSYFPQPVSIGTVVNIHKNYPFCIGKDEKGMLCWQTAERYRSWNSAFEDLARIYHILITRLNKDDKQYKTKWRNVFGYATSNSRLPSQILLKVCFVKGKTANGVLQQQYYGQIVHVPYNIPNWNEKKDGKQMEAWEYIHGFFDDAEELTGCMGRKTGGAAK